MTIHPVIDRLAQALVSIWQTHLDLSDYPMPEDLGYVEGKLEGERLTIQNTCYQTRQFRKLHLELAQVGSNLDILHCVMFPHPEYPLPIFGCDLVGGRGKISAAIADLSPTVPLNDSYTLPLQAGKSQYQNFSAQRELPEWGHIFSPYCLFTRLETSDEENLFLKIVGNMVELHCQNATTIEPSDPTTQALTKESIQHYCQQQQQNDKTRRILEKAFGQDWAERYMTRVLFDG